jgi:tetratricopeptide (TPR) repeat protein
VLAEYARAQGEPCPAWFLEIEGAVALARGDPEGAARYLRDSIAREGSWRRRYNLAVVLMAAKRFEEAMRELIQSETEFSPEAATAAAAAGTAPEAPQERSAKSQIRSRIAEAQMNLGDLEAARREALYALDLDRSNHHARRVLKILEGFE